MKTSSYFAAYKKAVDGSGTVWGFHKGLTHDQARDTDRFPLGLQYEKDGTPYIWAYGVNNGRKL